MAGGKAVRFSSTVKPPTKPTIGKASTTDSSKTDGSSHESGLPLARYTSIVGTQSLLLVFTALFLPRSTSSLLGPDFLPPPSSSLDRPQHPFLEPITASPVLTLFWLCLGVGFVIAWSSGYMRVWVKGDTSDQAGSQEDVKNSSLAAGRSKASSSFIAPNMAVNNRYRQSWILVQQPYCQSLYSSFSSFSSVHQQPREFLPTNRKRCRPVDRFASFPVISPKQSFYQPLFHY